VCRHLAEAHLGRGELDEALAYAQRSLTLARDQEMRLEEGCARRVLGQVCLARHELALAEQELQESLSILQDLNSLYEIGKTLFQIAWLYQVRGDQAQMQMRLGQAQSIFEGLGARLDLIRAQKLAQA
jgi:tetratricopeptide (TPR) repeat protein